VQSPNLASIGGDTTTHSLRFTISGTLKPWSKFAQTMAPRGGWYEIAKLLLVSFLDKPVIDPNCR
jgi:hypothetical protein